MYSTDGDCETCKHLNNHRYCENCSSNPDYEDLEDLYEPVSKEEMERIEKRDIEIRINQLQTETLEVSISEELLKSFEIAKGFTEKIKESLEHVEFPIPVEEVRRAKEPLTAVANGCMLAAQL